MCFLFENNTLPVCVCGKGCSSDNVYKGNLQEIKTQAAQNEGIFYNGSRMNRPRFEKRTTISTAKSCLLTVLCLKCKPCCDTVLWVFIMQKKLCYIQCWEWVEKEYILWIAAHSDAHSLTFVAVPLMLCVTAKRFTSECKCVWQSRNVWK